jgi:hypothetical protein
MVFAPAIHASSFFPAPSGLRRGDEFPNWQRGCESAFGMFILLPSVSGRFAADRCERRRRAKRSSAKVAAARPLRRTPFPGDRAVPRLLLIRKGVAAGCAASVLKRHRRARRRDRRRATSAQRTLRTCSAKTPTRQYRWLVRPLPPAQLPIAPEQEEPQRGMLGLLRVHRRRGKSVIHVTLANPPAAALLPYGAKANNP